MQRVATERWFHLCPSQTPGDDCAEQNAAGPSVALYTPAESDQTRTCLLLPGVESMAGAISNSEIEATYRQRTAKSAGRAHAAREIFPSGIVHDSRKIDPYPIYVDRAKGSHKWI